MNLSDITFPIRRDDGGYHGMTTLKEQHWCRDYTRDRFTGKGAIAELGCFFGSLTLSFADGLKAAVENGRLSRAVAKMESYDLFYWHVSMYEAVENSVLKDRIKEGEWFYEIYESNIAHMRDYINPHWQDLCKATWDKGPIELLMLDCLKYDAITNNVVPTFFRHTRPGLSRIVHQDYFHFYEWWTHVLTYEQRDKLKLEEEVPHSGMLVMGVEKDFGEYCEKYDTSRDFSTTPAELIEEAYDWNYSVISEDNHGPLTAARIWGYISTGQREKAEKLYHDNRERFHDCHQFSNLVNYCKGQQIPFLQG